MSSSDRSDLSSHPSTLHSGYHTEYKVYQRAIKTLLHGVINDNEEIISHALSASPERILASPPVAIESVKDENTRLRYFPEPAFVMAWKLRRYNVVDAMIKAAEAVNSDLLNKIYQTIRELEACNKSPVEIRVEKQKRYKEVLTPIMQAVLNEKYLSVDEDGIQNISHTMRVTLELFRQDIAPDAPRSIHDHYDMVQLLVVAIQLFREYEKQMNETQKQLFGIRVIGFIQNKIPTWLAELYCHPDGLNFLESTRPFTLDEKETMQDLKLFSKNYGTIEFYDPNVQPHMRSMLRSGIGPRAIFEEPSDTFSRHISITDPMIKYEEENEQKFQQLIARARQHEINPIKRELPKPNSILQCRSS